MSRCRLRVGRNPLASSYGEVQFHVIEDCCAGSDWDAHWAALTAMEYLQTGARISHGDFVAATEAAIALVL